MKKRKTKFIDFKKFPNEIVFAKSKDFKNSIKTKICPKCKRRFYITNEYINSNKK